MHKELNEPPEIKPDKNIFLINPGDEELIINKEEVLIKFLNNTLNKMNSFISNNFKGLMKLTTFCTICSLRTFSFTNFFFITFNLEKMIKKIKTFKILDIKRGVHFINQDKKRKKLYCNGCLKETKHFFYKEFYSVPNLLVISIQRGITYEYKNLVTISEKLDFKKEIEYKYCPNKFSLVGFLGRIDNNGNESFFSVCKKSQESWILCEGDKFKFLKLIIIMKKIISLLKILLK